MIEFKKWWKENTDHWGYIHEQGQTSIAKDTWIAALKWALLTGSWEIIAQEIKEEIYKTDVKT